MGNQQADREEAGELRVPSDNDLLCMWDAFVGDATPRLPLVDSDKLAFARAVLNAYGGTAEIARLRERLLAAEGDAEKFKGLLIECFELSDNWPGIAYTHDLYGRIAAALSPPAPGGAGEAN